MRQKSLVLIWWGLSTKYSPSMSGKLRSITAFSRQFWEHRPAEIYDRILLCDNLIDFTINRISQLRSSTFRGSCFAVFQSPSRFRAILIVIMPTRLLQLSNVWLFFLGWIRKSLIQVQKEKGISSVLVYVLHQTWNQAFSRCGRAKTAMKCTKKRHALTKLLFCLLNHVLVAVAFVWEPG